MKRYLWCKYHCDVCETVVECLQTFAGGEEEYTSMIQFVWGINDRHCPCCKDDPFRAPSSRLREHEVIPIGLMRVWDVWRLGDSEARGYQTKKEISQ